MSAGVTLKGQPPACAQYRTHPLPSAFPSQDCFAHGVIYPSARGRGFRNTDDSPSSQEWRQATESQDGFAKDKFKDIMGWRRVTGSMSNHGSLYSSSQSESLENNWRWKSVASWHQKVTWVQVKSQRIEQKWEVAPAAVTIKSYTRGFPPARLAAQLGDIRSVYSYSQLQAHSSEQGPPHTSHPGRLSFVQGACCAGRAGPPASRNWRLWCPWATGLIDGSALCELDPCWCQPALNSTL